MESMEKKLLRRLVERAPEGMEFGNEVQTALGPASGSSGLPGEIEFDLWRDVFVQQKMPWSSVRAIRFIARGRSCPDMDDFPGVDSTAENSGAQHV